LGEPLFYWSATKVAEAIRRREVSPVEVFEAVAKRRKDVDPKVNAYCSPIDIDLDGGRQAAKEAEKVLARNGPIGPLHGVPVAVKDDLAVEGLHYTCGSNLLADYIAEYDDLTVARLKRAGAIVLGKTNMPEFGHKGTTDNLLFGTTKNPWNLDYTAGGSSGGSAAAVAAGMAYLALGTDIGGSIRIPASCCGIIGFKPSLGRIPRVPAGNFSNTAWTSGPMARTVADIALGLRVLAGPDPRDPLSLPALEEGELDLTGDLRGLRIGWSPSPTGGTVESVVVESARTSLGSLQQLGVQIHQINESPEDASSAVEAVREAVDDVLSGDIMLMFMLMGVNSRWRFLALRALGFFSRKYRLSPSFAPFARRSFFTSLSAYINAHKKITLYVEQKANRYFEKHDLLASPTLALPPFPHPGLRELGPPKVDGKPITDRLLGWFFTWPFNLTGQPAISIRCGWTKDGLPLGLQIVGRRGADGLVLRVAAAIEGIGPWDDQHPPL
jgi:Asp-tRNA(Asn)/Glu-tRNA(Gln) amidotransferase A subunit family amidase